MRRQRGKGKKKNVEDRERKEGGEGKKTGEGESEKRGERMWKRRWWNDLRFGRWRETKKEWKEGREKGKTKDAGKWIGEKGKKEGKILKEVSRGRNG